jgi:hypothetical protein
MSEQAAYLGYDCEIGVGEVDWRMEVLRATISLTILPPLLSQHRGICTEKGEPTRLSTVSQSNSSRTTHSCLDFPVQEFVQITHRPASCVHAPSKISNRLPQTHSSVNEFQSPIPTPTYQLLNLRAELVEGYTARLVAVHNLKKKTLSFAAALPASQTHLLKLKLMNTTCAIACFKVRKQLQQRMSILILPTRLPLYNCVDILFHQLHLRFLQCYSIRSPLQP